MFLQGSALTEISVARPFWAKISVPLKKYKKGI
jgi:hypothetical protein